MFSPKPFGLHVDPKLSLSPSDLGFVDKQVRLLRNRLELADQKVGRRYATLNDGSRVSVSIVNGIERAIVTAPPSSRRDVKKRIKTSFKLPIIYSGRFTTTNFRQGEPDSKVTMQLTRQCRRRLAHYDPNDVNKIPSRIGDTRFNVELDDLMKLNFQSPLSFTSPIKHSQYKFLRPNWWSSTMAGLIQLISGYGKQPDDDSKYPFPRQIIETTEPYDPKYDIMPYDGKMLEDGEIKYRFFFDDTYGITYDDANEPWLVQITNGGVFAIPLPLIPETTTPEFREWCETVGDDELIVVLDAYGGIPTGEAFPIGKARQEWEKLGLIKNLCTTQRVGGGYSDAIGWSFNSRGHLAVNCSQRSEDITIGMTHLLTIKLQPIPSINPSEIEVRTKLYNRLVQYAIRDNRDLKVFKFRMMYGDYREIEETYRHIKSINSEAADVTWGWNVWKDATIPTLFNHDVILELLNEGWLWNNGSGVNQPQIKFPETRPNPLTGEYGSHSYGWNKALGNFTPVCSTIMYAYFAEDDLKLVGYFNDPRDYNPRNYSDKPPCEYNTSWTEITYTGGAKLAGNFYLSNLDEREGIAPTVTTTETRVEKVGTTNPAWAFPMTYRVATVFRTHVFKKTTRMSRTETNTFRCAICIPWGFRDGAIYVSEKKHTGGTKELRISSVSAPDPYSYKAYTYDFAFAYQNLDPYGNTDDKLDPNDITPTPRDGRPITITGKSYNPTPCDDMYNEGEWYSVGDDVTNEWYNQGVVFYSGGGGGVASVTPVTNIESVETEVTEVTYFSWRVDADICNKFPVKSDYYLPSPNPLKEGAIMLRQADCIRLGLKFYGAVQELGGVDGKDIARSRYWGYTGVVDVGVSSCKFMGVINE